MKKITLLNICFLFICFSNVGFCQKKKSEVPQIKAPTMPVNKETNLITYGSVVDLAGTPKELYDKALSWMNSYYKNPAEIIREKEEGVKLVAKGRVRLTDENPETKAKSQAGMAMYDFTISFKDGKYKYEITNFSWKQASFYPVERWVEENNKKYNYDFANYLTQVDAEIKALIKDMKSAMSKGQKNGKDNW